MSVQYRIDVLAALKDHGFSTYRIRREKLIPERVLTQFRQGILPSWEMIDRLCELLQCQPGDLLEHVQDSEVEKNF